jgi:hypothetical protein
VIVSPSDIPSLFNVIAVTVASSFPAVKSNLATGIPDTPHGIVNPFGVSGDNVTVKSHFAITVHFGSVGVFSQSTTEQLGSVGVFVQSTCV